ncbi:Hypothetical protein SMAX5B_008994 [Scophthalmus maximus]|uniref:Uncharacterized protein n=1 Tax=Scophthalmus maximus TaxID=52904 RepID=A0A2U9CHF1_SCOMX|nr:Hypothetical protein SMAX5B_008994 [Scophthalmus maximus]
MEETRLKMHKEIRRKGANQAWSIGGGVQTTLLWTGGEMRCVMMMMNVIGEYAPRVGVSDGRRRNNSRSELYEVLASAAEEERAVTRVDLEKGNSGSEGMVMDSDGVEEGNVEEQKRDFAERMETAVVHISGRGKNRKMAILKFRV